MFDNGAFSAFTKGTPVTDWTPYYEWCKDWLRHPGLDWVIIPDVIEGSELDNDMAIADWINWKGWKTRQAELSRWHLSSHSVPVWHLHESLERLQRLAKSWGRVAFGSSGEYWDVGSEAWGERMHEAFAAISVDGRPVCRVHGLRMADPAVFCRFPFASVDSTNVAQNAARESVTKNVSTTIARQIIAERIEPHNSPATYVAGDKQGTLFKKRLEPVGSGTAAGG